MRILKLPTFLVAGAICLAQKAAPPSGLRLTEDEIGVYKVFLHNYAKDATEPVNLGNRLTRLELSDVAGDGCLQGLSLQKVEPSRSANYRFSADLVSGTNVRVVDPEQQASVVKDNDPGTKLRSGDAVGDAVKSGFATGLLQVSEIAFERGHQHAVLEFGFHCGVLCGHGGTLVFEKVKGQWRETKRVCSVWKA